MHFESEITVEVDVPFDELMKILDGAGFSLMEEFDLNDIYMIDKRDLNETDALVLLSRCVLIRNMILKDGERKFLTYKYKEYNANREIVKQGNIKCEIADIKSMKSIFEKLHFEELITINDHCLVYSNGKDEFVLQSVNGKHLYIEIEESCRYADKFYRSIEEMKNVISEYGIPIKNNDYFVKKAEVELQERILKGE